MRWGNPWLAFVVFPVNAVLFRVAGSSLAVLGLGLALFLAGLAYAVAFRRRTRFQGLLGRRRRPGSIVAKYKWK